MNFDKQLNVPCIIPAAPVVDERCSDSAFALQNPSICGNVVSLILKPESALICRLGSIAFRVFEYRTGVETEVLDNITFTSSDDEVFAIGVHSGSGTGLAEGVVTITATRNGLTATADVTVLAENTCCDDTEVASSILIDNSRSMSLQFGGSYGTRLVFAKAAALLYGNPILLANGLPKDKVKVWSFNDAPTQVSSDFIQVDATVASDINGIQQSLNKTDLLEAITAAIDDLLNATADEKILVLVSDGEETTITNRQAILDYGALFKAAGGIIIVVAPRASGAGYDLLERLATGGFFLNAMATSAADVLDTLSYLKSILCVGRCVPAGDEYLPTPQLSFSSFTNWEVTQGEADLIGAGVESLIDVQPGNGLYVSLNGHGTVAGIMRSIDTFALVSGRTYRVAFDAAGNNLFDSPGANQALKAYLRDVSANDSDPNIFDHTVSPAWDSAFTTYSFTFVAPFDVTVRLYFEQLVSSGFAGTWRGNLLDNVVLDDVTSQITLLSDDFDQENLQYVSPNCGVGTTFVPGGSAEANLVPSMTGNTAPSGVASDSIGSVAPWKAFDGDDSTLTPAGGNANFWTQYDFGIETTINKYRVVLESIPASASFEIQGSNDNFSTWDVLDTQSLVPTGNPEEFEITFASPQTYKIFRIDFTTSLGVIYTFELIGGGITYAYEIGYYCYTECNSGTPGTQSVDPSPLPDIESNYTPPITFTSTKTVCATCDEGTVNVSDTNLVPVMTSNTAPSGVASASDNNAEAYKGFDGISTYSPLSAYQSVATPCWLQYQFTTAKTVAMYAITVWKPSGSPRDWTFEGSLNGTTWVELDSQSGITWFPGERKMFLAPNTTAYGYYRLTVSDSPPDSENGDTTIINELELYEAAPSQVCATESATSYVSQGAADAAAQAAALAAAEAQLNCVPIFTSTQSYTAVCDTNTFGSPVTRTVTKTSLVSQAEADQSALAEATELALSELDCEQSNNDELITINDKTGAAPAKATAFPSVQFVEGLSGVVTKVVVNLYGFGHTSCDDVAMLLRAPSGETCILWANVGGTNNVSGLNIVLDDAAGSFLPDSTALSSGTFKPKTYSGVPPFPAPAPQGVYGTTLAAFNGINPNGAWSLWIIDDAGLDSGSINSGFDLTITT